MPSITVAPKTKTKTKDKVVSVPSTYSIPETITRTSDKTSTKTATRTVSTIPGLSNTSNRPRTPFKLDLGSGHDNSNSFFKVSSGGKKWKNPGFVSDWVGSKPVKKGKGRRRRLF
jgi:hypothetical protein